MFQYMVQPGDNLYRISDYFDVSVAAILAANPGLIPHRIFPGQTILIPISGNLYQNYPWYYLLPYLFIQRPRRYWDDRSRWPRDWRDRDRDRGRRPRDWRDRDRNRDRYDGNRRRRPDYMGNWNDMITAQDLDDWDESQASDMNDLDSYQLDNFLDQDDYPWRL